MRYERTVLLVVDWRSGEFCERYRSGDRQVLQAVYWAYVDGVDRLLAAGFVTRAGQSTISGVRDGHARADLLQEVFLKAFQAAARHAFDAKSDYRPYLWAIARNTLIDHHRRARRDRMRPQVDAAAIDTPAEEATDPLWTSAPLVNVVAQYVAGLGPELRSVHEARFVRGQSQRDAAETLGMSRQSLRTLERHLKDGLRNALEAASSADTPVRTVLDGEPIARRLAEGRGQ